MTDSHMHSTWIGLAFERLCLEHLDQIKEALCISCPLHASPQVYMFYTATKSGFATPQVYTLYMFYTAIHLPALTLPVLSGAKKTTRHQPSLPLLTYW